MTMHIASVWLTAHLEPTQTVFEQVALGYFENILAWLTVVSIVWFLSRYLATPGAKPPRLRERVASVLGLRTDPRDGLWWTITDAIVRREYGDANSTYLLIWSLENLESGYLYTFPPPGVSRRAPRLLPIDPCRNSGPPQLVLLVGKAKSFKTRSAKAIAQALDERNLATLGSKRVTADLVHIREFYGNGSQTDHVERDLLVKEIVASVREHKNVAGDLLYVIDVMKGWSKDEIVSFLALLIRNSWLCKAEGLTVLLVIPDLQVSASGPGADTRRSSLEYLNDIYNESQTSQLEEVPPLRAYPWRLTCFRTVHLGPDTIIDRLAEELFVELSYRFRWLIVRPWSSRTVRMRRRLALQQTLRDLAATAYDRQPQLAEGPTDPPDPQVNFYTFWAKHILRQVSLYTINNTCSKAYGLIKASEGLGNGRVSKRATRAYLHALKKATKHV